MSKKDFIFAAQIDSCRIAMKQEAAKRGASPSFRRLRG